MGDLRAFFAIELAEATTRLLVSCRESLLDADSSWAAEKWVAPGNLHVTLAFMPALPHVDVRSLLASAQEVLADIPAARLQVSGVEARPRDSSARMLWASLDELDGGVSDLATALDDLCGPLLAPTRRHRFRPHVTLCRARRPRRVSERGLQAAASAIARSEQHERVVSVPSATLFHSTLGPDGPSYRPLGIVRLGRV